MDKSTTNNGSITVISSDTVTRFRRSTIEQVMQTLVQEGYSFETLPSQDHELPQHCLVYVTGGLGSTAYIHDGSGIRHALDVKRDSPVSQLEYMAEQYFSLHQENRLLLTTPNDLKTAQEFFQKRYGVEVPVLDKAA